MRLRALARTLAPALLVCAICGWRIGPGDPVSAALEARLYDWRLQARPASAAPPPVALIAVDETTVARAAPGRALRAEIADATAALQAEGAAAVVIDFLFIEPTVADAGFADSLAATPGAVLAVAALNDGAAGGLSPEARAALERSAFRVVVDRAGGADGAAERPALATPAPELARAALLGHVNIIRAPDRVVRRLPLALDIGEGRALPSVALVAARLALGLAPGAMILRRGEGVALGPRVIAADAAGRVLVDHLGPSGAVPRVELGAFLAGARPPGGVAGRAVFIGATAESLGDVWATPLDPDAPGVETLAAAAAQFIEGRALDDGPRAAAATLALALAAGAGARMAALAGGVAVALAASMGVWIAAALAAQALLVWSGLVVDGAALLLSAASCSALGWIARASRERLRAIQAERAEARLRPHVTPLLARIEALGADAAQERQAAVAFVDMIGSTRLAEALGAEAAARRMAATHARIGAAAARRGGMVSEVIGDGAIVVFDMPQASGAVAGHGAAARAALLFLREITGDPREGETVALRATAHFGTVAFADLGSEGLRRVTVVGDAVNVAARLQDAARREGVRLLVSRQLADSAGDAGGLRRLGFVRLPGREGALELLAG